jgi:hypothetical protein
MEANPNKIPKENPFGNCQGTLGSKKCRKLICSRVPDKNIRVFIF